MRFHQLRNLLSASLAAVALVLTLAPWSAADAKPVRKAAQKQTAAKAAQKKIAVKTSSRKPSAKSVNVANAKSVKSAKLTKRELQAMRSGKGKGASVKVAARSTGAFKVVRRGGRLVRIPLAPVRVAFQPERPSFGQAYGLRQTDDPLELKSSVALVLDQDTHQVLFAKNTQAVLPIASITKLMTALVVVDARQAMDETLLISQEDVDTEKGSRSRLSVGTQLTRGEMLHLALMSSENRAANSLGRHFPGGLQAFVAAMNTKAKTLGMLGTRYVEPTGLSSQNQSNASDLAVLVQATYEHEVIRNLSTSPEASVAVGSRQVQFHNTNRLISNPSWDIGLQKTGYISEAGRCLVMQAEMAGRKLIMVLLDSAGKYSRLGDAERIRTWLASAPLPAPLAGIAPAAAAARR